MNKLTGYVLWTDKRDGNGIIKDSSGNEFYFDTSVCPEFNKLKRKDSVIFEHNSTIKDSNCAHNVTKFIA